MKTIEEVLEWIEGRINQQVKAGVYFKNIGSEIALYGANTAAHILISLTHFITEEAQS